MDYVHIVHKLTTRTSPAFFQNVKVGDIVNFSFKATDPNFGHLSGNFLKKEKYVCVAKSPWSISDTHSHYKYNFKPLNAKAIDVVVPIANTRTGEILTCSIYDKKYSILDVRSKEHYYPQNHIEDEDLTPYVEILFEPSTEEGWNLEKTKEWLQSFI